MLSNRRRIPWGLILALALGFSSVASAAPGIVSQIEVGKNWLRDGDDLAVKVTVTNGGNASIWIPTWQMPKGQLDANLFEVTLDGEPVRYLGRLFKRAAPGRSEMIELKPGKSLRGQVELTANYDFSAEGEYLIRYRLDLLDGVEIAELRKSDDEVYSNVVQVWREAPERAQVPELSSLAEEGFPEGTAIETEAGSRAWYSTHCSASRITALSSALTSAKAYAQNSKSYLANRTYTTVGPRYKTWFGVPTSTRFAAVKSHFTKITDAFVNKPVVIDCACPYAGVYAYVYPSQPYKIWVCPVFWRVANTGTDSRAGTLVHEMSHFTVVAATDDWEYGQSACKSLAIRNPAHAVDNADSHEYFAENKPAQK